MTIVVLVTIALVGANALFVAAEFAVVAVPRAVVERHARRGDRLARRIAAIIRSPREQDRYIATAQLGITLASLGLGMYGEHTLAAWFEPRLGALGRAQVLTAHALASVAAVTLLSYLHVFLGEMIPKTLALSHAARTARVVYWPMRATLAVLYPFVYLLNSVGSLVLAALGVRRQVNPREQFYTPEELRIVVEESEREGALGADSGKILRELLEFGDLTAGEVMVPRVRIVGIPVGARPEDVRRLLAEHRHTRYPVYDGDLDHIVGMLHVKDLLRRLIAGEAIATGDVRRIPVVPETAPGDDVLRTMQQAQAHMAIIIDEHGGTAGLISLEDLFEEVVGELEEGGPAALPIVALADGSVRARGTVRLDELGQHFNLDLEHEDVDSVSGLVLARLGRPPVVGDVVDYDRIRLEVTATSGRGVREVRASLREGT